MSAERAFQDSPWGRGYSLGIPIPTEEPLTREEIEELADRTPIIVLWPGGNGPAEYTLVKVGEWSVAAIGWELANERWDFAGKVVGPDAFVGNQPFHTKVWLR